ncbi:MAG TPA: type II toxin-antitoxin system RelE/ParE family toxin [Arenimonas sp.]|nr:type II toxin-antitoxin system RelE/ParE family toxin [Arenimonas sp.]
MAIQSFACKDSQALNDRHRVKRWAAIESVARRKLAMLEAAVVLRDLATPPGNHLEALKRDRAGQHSIRINQQYRICFVWTDEGPANVEIVDYH